MRHKRLEHQFVRYIPEQLEPGVIYVSMEYSTAVHRCCCGCGQEIVTPFTPIDWKMTFDGETISLWPSVGNWKLPCRSHYIIRLGQVVEALPWTESEIAAEQRRDKEAKRRYGVLESLDAEKPTTLPPTPSQDTPKRRSRFKSWLSRIQRAQ